MVITVSTAEAELYSMSEANLLLASISPLIEELVGVVRRVTYHRSKICSISSGVHVGTSRDLQFPLVYANLLQEALLQPHHRHS